MGWRRWGLALTVLAGLSGLAVAGRLLDVAEDRPSAARSAAPVQSLTIATVPPPRIPTALRRPLRLPSLRRDGSCPATPAAGPPMPGSDTVAAVTLGDGPVYPVLFKNAVDGGLDRTSAVYWDAPEPLGGVAIVRGHQLGRPQDPIRFQDDNREMDVVAVLDPASARRTGSQGHWWRTSLRAGVGCYGLQIDGPRFSKVLVVEFRS
jgi:hypothetical protein